MQLKRSCYLFALCVFSLQGLAAEPREVDAEPISEAKIKAAMVYRFLAYVEWPDSQKRVANSPYNIIVLGAPEIAAELLAIAELRQVNNRALTIVSTNTVAQIKDADVIVVGARAARRLSTVARLAQNMSALVVTELEEGLKDGSVINLKNIGERVVFEVSLPGAQRNSLKLSSRLLAVAATVEQ